MLKIALVCVILIVALLHCVVTFDISHIQAEQPIPISPLSAQDYELAVAQMRNTYPPFHKQGHTCGTDEINHSATHDTHHSSQQETASVCPTKTECDIPAIRDQYTAVGNTRMLHVEFLIERNSSLFADANNIISVALTNLNNAYSQTGFQFTASAVFFGPAFPLANGTVGKWYINDGCEAGKSQPCVEHTLLANQILASRGGFKKRNTVVVLVASLQQSNTSSNTLLGFAHFPWTPDKNGLVVVIPYTMTNPGDTTVAHEIGHSLGLWHIFRGSSEMYEDKNCPADPVAECYEEDGSDISGDFCDDTGPFPNTVSMTDQTCRAPTVVEFPDYCKPNRTAWSTVNTFSNYMAYTADACQTSFSPKQMRRMRCYVDRMGYPTGIAPAYSSFSRPMPSGPMPPKPSGSMPAPMPSGSMRGPKVSGSLKPKTSTNSTRGQTSGTPLDPKPVGAAAQFSFIFAVLLTFVFCLAIML